MKSVAWMLFYWKSEHLVLWWMNSGALAGICQGVWGIAMAQWPSPACKKAAFARLNALALWGFSMWATPLSPPWELKHVPPEDEAALRAPLSSSSSPTRWAWSCTLPCLPHIRPRSRFCSDKYVAWKKRFSQAWGVSSPSCKIISSSVLGRVQLVEPLDNHVVDFLQIIYVPSLSC